MSKPWRRSFIEVVSLFWYSTSLYWRALNPFRCVGVLDVLSAKEAKERETANLGEAGTMPAVTAFGHPREDPAVARV